MKKDDVNAQGNQFIEAYVELNHLELPDQLWRISVQVRQHEDDDYPDAEMYFVGAEEEAYALLATIEGQDFSSVDFSPIQEVFSMEGAIKNWERVFSSSAGASIAAIEKRKK